MSRSSDNFLSTIKSYGKNLMGFIRKRVSTPEDAEDILQEVWFQLGRIVDLDEIENISGWLFSVARNKIIDNYRKKKSVSIDNEDDTIDPEQLEMLINYELPEDEFMRELFWEDLFQALDELPELQRIAFIQNELEDKTLQQIADESNENLKTIISRKRFAIQHLRKRMQGFYDDLID
jgi:RNA polymerase sigma factor (sigma-70 family)